jgi:hypothetical protein
MSKFPRFHGPLAAAMLTATLALAAPSAHALPPPGATCTITTYYSDASMTTKVGSYSTCPGSRGLTGRKTAFFETDDIEITPTGPKPPGQNPLPCEFKQDCVVNLPTPIVVKPWPPKKK